MEIEGISFDRPNVREVLVSRAARASIARILGRWKGSRRPALLFVLVGEMPYGDVYAEEDLLSIFPVTTTVESEMAGRDIEGPLRVYVADQQGTTVYRIADPRSPGMGSSISDGAHETRERNAAAPRELRS